jgi:predicted porin
MKKKLVPLCALMACSAAVQAQTSNVILYGNLDQYIGHIRSNTGTNVTGLYDGAILRSRIGFRGTEELGGGIQAKFLLEGGFNTDSGTLADSARLFDRQAWLGVNTPIGEFRFGRQNTQAQAIGSAIDYTERTTFGSVVNLFGVPSRYNNDITYLSPRIANIQLVAHYALGEIAGGGAAQSAIYQLGLDFANGPYRVGYAGLAAKPRSGVPFDNRVQYHNLYGTFDYGRGKIYLAAVRSNNITSTGTGTALTTTSGQILSNTGSPDNVFPPTTVSGPDLARLTADVRRFFHIYQVSADYRINQQLRVGALYGVIRDREGSADAKGANIGAFYDLSKRTTLYGFANWLKNDDSAGFRFSGSAGPTPNLAGDDVNGRRLTGYQVGVLHRF